jgi:hypothetical protein
VQAKKWLQRRGERVLASNWRTRFAELDLLTHRGERSLWIYEVKATAEPEMSLRSRQTMRLLRAQAWLEDELMYALGSRLGRDLQHRGVQQLEVGVSLLVPDLCQSVAVHVRNNIEFMEIPVLD